MKSAELRQRFLDYFARHGHQVVSSSSLVPANDATLLFTNAGMVQFKDVFLGDDKRSYQRATTSQRCVRAGGKHNDLENVGYTARHHTFFEMLGNFSFGDYFKQEAIRLAWQFVTEELGLPKEKLWVTVFRDDDEAADIWVKEIGIDPARVTRMGEKDNFWSMGDTGPCGPCSEIFFDHGPEVWGGPPGTPEEDGDRYIEIWNLVFMQFDRAADGTMTPLPKPSVDTGMGLERVAAVLQNVHSNYEIDLFAHLIEAAAKVTGCNDLGNKSLRVIADHIRACSFLIVDGVLPSNEGRGYVLRRIIRRAYRHGYKLGMRAAFFHQLVPALVQEMGEAYPELAKAEAHVTKVLKQEEERFSDTLDQGMRILDAGTADLTDKKIPGDLVFKLYDTYGFPPDLTADIAREREMSIDQTGFDEAMNAQRTRAREASKFGADYGAGIKTDLVTDFIGYEHTQGSGKVVALYRGADPVTELAPGEQGVVLLDRTPFYGESGGQVGDTGTLDANGGAHVEVTDTQKFGKAHAHIGTVSGASVKLGDALEASINVPHRQAVVLNHSATHLMHAALREVLGDHVQQKGSRVDADRLRFDFSHYEAASPAELGQIEAIVNAQVRQNVASSTREMAFDDAIAAGALAFFDDKYDEHVRVLQFGEFSTELCGGTHVQRVGDIGLFKIISEGGIAAGVRRIEAVTGAGALNWVSDTEKSLQKVAGLIRGGRDDVLEKVGALLERNRALEKELGSLKQKMAGARGDELTDQAVEVNGIKVLAARLDGVDAKVLRDTVDRLKDKLGSAAVVLATVDGDKVRLVAGVTKDHMKSIKAGELVNAVAQQVGGRGGGRPDMAQAGGTDPGALDAALSSVVDWVAERA